MIANKQPVNHYLKLAIILASLVVSLGLIYAGSRTSLPKLPALATINQQQPGLYRVVETLDGDTIVVDYAGLRETVRLIGVDTPETHDPRKPVQCYGQTAASFTKRLLAGQKVRLEADPADSDRDKYQRLLRYVYLADGRLVNAELIARGYGFAYTIFPYAKLEEFKALERQARSANLGLWKTCPVDDTHEVKQTSPE